MTSAEMVGYYLALKELCLLKQYESVEKIIDAVKANKKMMDKFSDDFDKPAVGTLMNEKK